MHGHGGPQGAPATDIDSKAVLTYEGWFSIHAVYGINYEKWQSWTAEKQAQALREFKGFLAELEVGHEAHTSSYALYHVAGGKGDLLFWFLQPTLEEVTDVEMKLRKLLIGAVLEPKSSFVSVIEVSNYMKFDINHPRVQARLYPKVPRLKYICFYPMSKKREVGENWYMTPREERGRMMRSHGQIGRKYEATVKEFTTGAYGLDDHEWGITLMCDDPVPFKKLVQEMRFDEVSARFALFGHFTVGTLMDEDRLAKVFG
ncbi:MAG: heme-dependent peroxidase [Veillonella sp.]|nr:heme-dependent peroxidase [Veillonella sp.]